MIRSYSILICGKNFSAYLDECVPSKLYISCKEVKRHFSFSHDNICETMLKVNEEENTNTNYVAHTEDNQTDYLISLEVLMELLLSSPLKVGYKARQEVGKMYTLIFKDLIRAKAEALKENK